MNKLIILALVLVAMPFALSQTISLESLCVQQTACEPNVAESTCVEPGKYIDNPTATTSDELEEQYCKTGCCDYGSISGQLPGTTIGYCEATGGTWQETCDEDVDVVFCQQGETNCQCGGETLSEGTICCNGAPTTQDSCDAVNQGICGNNILESGEAEDPTKCDFTVANSCPVDFTCSNACTCNPEPTCTGDECEQDPDETVCTQDNIGITATVQEGLDRAIIQWSVSPACQDQIETNQIVYQEVDDPNGFTKIYSFENPSGQDQSSSLEPETEYKWTYVVKFENSENIYNKSDFVDVGLEKCHRSVRSFCDESNDVFSCNSKNYQDEKLSEVCENDKEVCVPTQAGFGAQAICVPAYDCSLCNKGYGTFAEESQASLQIGKDTIVACQDAVQRQQVQIEETQITVGLCYEGYADGPQQVYNACSEIVECNEYTNQQQCDGNTCLLEGQAGTCEWDNTGICLNANSQTCNVNDVTEEQCKAIGESCEYLQGNCRDPNEVICEDLSVDQCAVDSEFVMDLETYNITSTSDNAYNLPKCRVINNNCTTDRDYNDISEEATVENKRDHTNPVTVILTDLNQEFGAKPVFSFAVDDEYPTRTYAKINQSEDGTCPQGRDLRGELDIVNQEQQTISPLEDLETGTYCLYYMSEDIGANLELIQAQPFTVNTILPEFEVEPESTVVRIDDYFKINHTWQLQQEAECQIEAGDRIYSPGLATQFNVGLLDEPAGTLVIDGTCSNSAGEITWNDTLDLQLDNRVARPIPAAQKTTPGEITEISIQTADEQAQCSYRKYPSQEWVPFENTREVRSATQHYAEIQTQQQGFYLYQTRCEFPGGSISQLSEDTIYFAVDGAGPTPEIQIGEAVFGPSDELITGFDGIRASVTCTDRTLAGIPRDELANPDTQQNWQFGSAQYRINDSEYKDLDAEFIVQQGGEYEIQCVDKGGNEGPVTLFTADADDFTGPQRPSFEVQS